MLGVILVAGCATAAKEPPLTPEQRQLNLESFDYVWTTIRDKHWDPELGGLDWAAIRDDLRPRVEQAAVMSESRAAFFELINRLGQSHFAIIPAELYKDMEGPAGEGRWDGVPGITVRVVDRHALVTAVNEGSPAAEGGVRPGWEIVGVGDEDLIPKLEAVGEEFADKTWKDHTLARVVTSRWRGPVGEPVAISFIDGEGRKVDLDVPRVEERGRRIQFGNLPPMYVWTEVKTLDDSVGYIAFSSFFDPINVMPVFNEAMTSFMDTEGLVIDVRGNPGGIGPMAMGMAGWLIEDEKRHLGTMYMRNAELNFVVIPRVETYRGPVALLVDGLSGSAAEIFAGGLKDLGRARVFGGRTVGAALPSTIERLPNGDGFQYAFANYVSAGGEELEGIGVIPHVEVAPTREALLEGRDPVVEAAVAWIKDQR